jgi:F-type H+-transporting ATPase subunit a
MASLAPETLFQIGPVPITNTVLDTLLVDILIISLAVFIYKKHTLVPGFFQAIIEIIIETFHEMIRSVAGERTKRIFPFAMTFFFVIVLANWTGLTPILTGIGVYHGEELVPLIRSASTDLNFTFSLALISLVVTHGMSIQLLGIKEYLGKFFSLKPLALSIGLLELILEFAKIISFSFRLFGNIFVGKIMLLSATSVFAFLLPLPVLLYELFVGFVQAAIFALLTMAFMAIMTTSHKTEH